MARLAQEPQQERAGVLPPLTRHVLAVQIVVEARGVGVHEVPFAPLDGEGRRPRRLVGAAILQPPAGDDGGLQRRHHGAVVVGALSLGAYEDVQLVPVASASATIA